MKALVEAAMSTIINKKVVVNEFQFEIVYRSTYEYIQRQCNIQQNKTTLVQSPFTTLGQEM